MSASSVRAAVVSKEHHHIADFSNVVEETVEGHSRSRTSSKSSTGRRNSSPIRDELETAQDILTDLNPGYTSTPIDGGGSGNGGRKRIRSHSGNSVTFHGATPIRPETLPVAHSSGVMANPLISRTNPDEIIILEGDSSLTSSTSSNTQSHTAATGGSLHQSSHLGTDVQVQAPIVGYEIMEERARFTVSERTNPTI